MNEATVQHVTSEYVCVFVCARAYVNLVQMCQLCDIQVTKAGIQSAEYVEYRDDLLC